MNDKNKKRIHDDNGGNKYYVNACRNMEEKLNKEFDYVNDKNRHLLLSMMIYRLQMFLDIYIQSLQSENQSYLNKSGDAPMRIHRGRDRRHQYH